MNIINEKLLLTLGRIEEARRRQRRSWLKPAFASAALVGVSAICSRFAWDNPFMPPPILVLIAAVGIARRYLGARYAAMTSVASYVFLMIAVGIDDLSVEIGAVLALATSAALGEHYD